MLWDLYEKDGVPLDDVTAMVMKGIDLLVSNSGYRHLVVSLMLVDHAEFGDKYCSKIMARAQARGLGAMLTDVTCESIAAASIIEEPSATYESTVTPTNEVSTRSSKRSCGVLSEAMNPGNQSGLLVIMTLPLLLYLARRRS